MARKVTEFAREYADREAIRDCLTRYYRGVDRIDGNMMVDVFWPNATIDQGGTYKGLASDFVAFAIPHLKSMEQTAHQMGNCLIEIDGSVARSETYVVAYHGLRGSKGESDLFAGVRYLDELEKRRDEWRVSQRVLVIDWLRDFQGSTDWAKGFLGHSIGPAGRKARDPSFELLTSRKNTE